MPSSKVFSTILSNEAHIESSLQDITAECSVEGFRIFTSSTKEFLNKYDRYEFVTLKI